MRYRFHAVAFGLGAALMPLALLAAALRPAVVEVSPAGRLLIESAPLVPVVARIAVAIAVLLLIALVLDVTRVLVVKRRALRWGTMTVRRAGLRESAAVFTPTAIGYLHPAIVVPAGFRARVDAGEWAAVLAHESAHLARGDDWAKALQSLLLRAGWWLPGLWLLGRALDLERELASDERAAETSGPRRYAACLLRLATDRCGGIAPALWDRRSHVAIRVERLLRPPPGAGPVARGVALGVFTATALAVVATALVAVPARTINRHAQPHIATRSAPPGTLSGTVRAPHVAARLVPRRAAQIGGHPIALVPARHVLRTWHVRAARARDRVPAATVLATAARSRRPCPTCFGPAHLPGDAYAPAAELVDPAAADEGPSGGGAIRAGTVLWVRSPASALNP